MARTPRMDQIEAMLKEDPNDQFLRYGLAMEHVSANNHETAVTILRDLIAASSDKPYIPAYLQAAQALCQLGREPEAADILREGIGVAAKAATPEALHAKGEMEGLLATID